MHNVCNIKKSYLVSDHQGQHCDCLATLDTCKIIIKFSYLKPQNVCKSDVWLTVHRNSVWIRKTN